MKIQSPWMGRVRGSAGNMTGSKVYDKNVMRAKAFEVSNPNTTAQQTERSFFAEVSQCVASVSEAELRSLFGVKPKGMSRRNALTKQVSEAYSIDGTSKTLDFSKLLAIGNGEKVDTNIYHAAQTDAEVIYDPAVDKLNVSNLAETNVIFVVFNVTKQKIVLVNTEFAADAAVQSDEVIYGQDDDDEQYIYPTCAVGGGNVYLRGFGSFIIKTRAEKK